MARSRRSAGEAGGAGEARAVEPTSPSSSGAPAFEGALAELEAVVGRLESGDLPLEQALEAFESGVRLSRQCAATLDAAERRIEILMAERGGWDVRVEPFAAAGGGARGGANRGGAGGDLDRDEEDDADDVLELETDTEADELDGGDGER